MNNLLLTKRRDIKAKKLHNTLIATFKKGIFTTYKSTVIKERKTKTFGEI